MNRDDGAARPVGPRELHEHVVSFVRAFGLLERDTTPCGQPISVSEAHTLGELAAGPCAQGELCRRLRLEKSTISRLVSQLTSRGWVERRADQRDGRAVVLHLTDAGRSAAERLAQARHDKFTGLIESIPIGERALVVRALATLTEALDDQAGRK